MAVGRLIGTDQQGSTNLLDDYMSLTKFTALATGIISEIQIYSVASGNVKVGIYEDSSGSPTNLLASNQAGTACTAYQWNSISISLEITEGTDYWLATNMDTDGVGVRLGSGTGTRTYKTHSYGTAFPDPTGYPTGWTDTTAIASIAGFGVLLVSPSGISQPVNFGSPELIPTIKPSSVMQPIAYGTPKLNLSVKPAGAAQAIAYGTPSIEAGKVLSPAGLEVVVAYGTPTLTYPQTVSPMGLAVTIVYGTPAVGLIGYLYPAGVSQPIAIGAPTILKYVWHVVLDGQYLTESPETNRSFVIGRDQYGNPVWGEAHDTTESALVGERLDFQQEVAIPTTAQATSTAEAILSKIRLTKQRGVILIPPNCGQELFDVVELTDKGANQSAVKFRVVGIRFEYIPKQARYHHKLILGAP